MEPTVTKDTAFKATELLGSATSFLQTDRTSHQQLVTAVNTLNTYISQSTTLTGPTLAQDCAEKSEAI